MHQIRLRRQHHKNKKFLNQVIHLDFANDAVPYNAHSKVIYYFVERDRRRNKQTALRWRQETFKKIFSKVSFID